VKIKFLMLFICQCGVPYQVNSHISTLRLRPALHSRALAWDLAIVLEGLVLTPFEEVSEKFLTLKTLFLLAIFLSRELEICKPFRLLLHVWNLHLVW